jgi:hypothetical protein
MNEEKSSAPGSPVAVPFSAKYRPVVTSAITAGVCTVTYAANDGTPAQVDVLSLVTAASTAFKTSLTKGASTVASAIERGQRNRPDEMVSLLTRDYGSNEDGSSTTVPTDYGIRT